jgi:hypothetical protein
MDAVDLGIPEATRLVGGGLDGFSRLYGQSIETKHQAVSSYSWFAHRPRSATLPNGQRRPLSA